MKRKRAWAKPKRAWSALTGHALLRSLGARQITEIREVQLRTDLTLEKLARRLVEVTDKLDGLIVIVDDVIRRPNLPPSAL